MTASDLMIGDYVEIGNAGYWRATLATLQLTHDEPDKVNPVLLTKDIVNKNFQQETTGIYKLYGNLYLIRHHIEKDKWMVNWMENADDPNYRVVTYIKYVHELQHMLRLCGIEKEIVL